MKNLILSSFCVLFGTILYAQDIHTVSYDQWDDKSTFENSPEPIVLGYGCFSDTLQKLYGGVEFFECNQTYYPIETWADYYLWFTHKYWFEFDEPELYQYYYVTENEEAMASYIASHYEGKTYPSLIKIDLWGNSEKYNQTQKENCLPLTHKDIEKLNEQLAHKIEKFGSFEAREIQERERKAVLEGIVAAGERKAIVSIISLRSSRDIVKPQTTEGLTTTKASIQLSE